MVGDGPLQRAELAARVAPERLRASRCSGRQDDVASLLGAADLALLTSTWEARALVAQEALLAGVPLVSTRVGGIPELVGDAAVLVDLDDDRAGRRRRALLTLADDPERAGRLGRRGPAPGRHLARRGRCRRRAARLRTAR